WDYRYTWIRDAAFTIYALMRIGFTHEAGRFKDWLAARWRDAASEGPGPLQLMYGIDGRSELTEVALDHLEGYRGSRPVRIGNGAHQQLQLDIYGELLDSAYSYIYHEGFLRRQRSIRGGRDLRELCCVIADYVVEHWRDKDRGIWEVR